MGGEAIPGAGRAVLLNIYTVLGSLPVGTTIYYTAYLPGTLYYEPRPEFAAVVGLAPTTDQAEQVTVINDGLRVRSGPAIKVDNVIDALKAGTALNVRGDMPSGGINWTQIVDGPFGGRYVARSQGGKQFLKPA